MKNIFFTHSLLLCFLITGCVQSQKDSQMTFSEKSSTDDTNRDPASEKTNDITPASPDILDSEQTTKLDPASCKFGWQLKNSNIVNENFKKAYAALTNNSCLSCHSSSSTNYAPFNYSTTEQMLGKKGLLAEGDLINPLDLKKSLLLTKLSNYGGSMPALSDTDLEDVKNWIKFIEYECLTEKEVETTSTKQIKTEDAVIDQTTKTFTTSFTNRSTTTLKISVPNKIEASVTISEKDSKTITAESVDLVKNLTKELVKDKYKTNTFFVTTIKNRILKIEEKNIIVGSDGLTFSLSQTHNLNLQSGVNAKTTVTLADLPEEQKNEINKIETTITTTGTHLNGVSTIIQKTKTLSKADNTFAVKDRTYVIDANKLAYTEFISAFGPKNTITTANGIRSEISVNAYLKNGKTYIEKKIVKTLADGALVDGSYSGTSVVGSSTTTSEIDGNNFTFTTIPLLGDKTKRPIRTCDIAALEKKIETQSSTSTGRWIASKNMNIRCGDRYYVLSVLTKIFSPSILGTAGSINSLNTVFGGNFDIYDIAKDDVTKKTINTSPEGYALTAVNTTPTNDSIGPLNPIRLATTIRVCEDIVKNNTFVLNAIKNTVGNQSLTTANLPYPFKQDFINAYNLFYPSDPISENTTNALVCVADTETSALDQWRNIFLTLCITPEWQIP